MLDGVSTKKEKEYVLEEYVSGLEAQGWFLKGPVEAIWAGERAERAAAGLLLRGSCSMKGECVFAARSVWLVIRMRGGSATPLARFCLG